MLRIQRRLLILSSVISNDMMQRVERTLYLIALLIVSQA
jgi:hypothetical protein